MHRYYYSDGTNQFGPYSLEELKGKNLEPNYLVWYHGMEHWQEAKTLPELQGLFKNYLEDNIPSPPPLQREKPREETAPQKQQQFKGASIGSGATLDSTDEGVKPKTWLVEAILCTILACLPFGIVAIVYAANVDSQWNARQYAQARHSASLAKTWVLVSFFVALAFWVIYILMVIVAVSTASRMQNIDFNF